MLRETTVECGALRGEMCGDPRITVFKGVPFAKPPLGELRWCAPVPPEPWADVYSATEFAPMAVQRMPGLNWSEFYTKEVHPTAYEYSADEDCLYLNVWTPAASADERLPVFVFIHGGGYTGGYSYTMEFDGERVARKGCVFVTIAYRLGALGFFAHPDLSAERPGESQGNFGFLDQLEALRWIQRNIAAFGGDPSRVTVAGQSAGAGSVTALLSSRASEGLVSGAMLMSGGGLDREGNDCRSLEEAQREGERLLGQLGVRSVTEARRLPARVLVETMESMRQPGSKFCVDGAFLAESPRAAILGGRWPRIPYLMGYTQGEGNSFFGPRLYAHDERVEAFETRIRRVYGDRADEYLRLAGVRSEDDIRALHRSDGFHPFLTRLGGLAQVLAGQGRAVYLYKFDHDMPGDDGAGSYHGSDLWFAFDALGHNWRPFHGAHYDLARQVSMYFVHFCAQGDPNGPDDDGSALPQWARYTGPAPELMVFRDRPRLEREWSDPLLTLRMERYLSKR